MTIPVEVHPTKKQTDAIKIENFKRAGHTHLYNYHEWLPWTGNHYIKSFYDVMLPDGSVIKYCWPNAGKMNAPGGRKFTEYDDIRVVLSASSPFLD